MVRLVSLCLLFAFAPVSAALALPPDQVAKRGLDAVVTVRATVGSQTRSGSGVLIDRDMLVTLASTVTGADKVEFRRVGEEQWRPVDRPHGTDRKSDVVIFTLPAKEKVRPVKPASKPPGIGAEVYAVSAPLKTQGRWTRT
jgi:S1-C subfamily serine protease